MLKDQVFGAFILVCRKRVNQWSSAIFFQLGEAVPEIFLNEEAWLEAIHYGHIDAQDNGIKVVSRVAGHNLRRL